MGKQRHNGKRVVIGFLLFVAAIVAALMTAWWVNIVPAGDVVAALPLGEDRVAMLRMGNEERGHVHIGVWGAAGHHWSTALFEVRSPSLVSDGERLYVRTVDDRGADSLHAYDLATGEVAYVTFIDEEQTVDAAAPWDGETLFVAGEHIVALDFINGVVQVRSRADGEEVARHPMNAPEAAWVQGDVFHLKSAAGVERIGEARSAGVIAVPEQRLPRGGAGTGVLVDGDEVRFGTQQWTIAGITGAAPGNHGGAGQLAVWRPEGVAVFSEEAEAPLFVIGDWR